MFPIISNILDSKVPGGTVLPIILNILDSIGGLVVQCFL